MSVWQDMPASRTEDIRQLRRQKLQRRWTARVHVCHIMANKWSSSVANGV